MTELFLLVSLTVLFPVSRSQVVFFRDSPASTTVLANFPTSLSCTYEPPPSIIMWEMNGIPLSPDDVRVFVTFNATTGSSVLRIARVVYEDGGDYVCKAFSQSEDLLASSQSGTITVQGIPAFSSILSPITAMLGGSASFQCDVVSNPAPTNIRWFYELGGTRQNLTSEGRITISPTNTLTIRNIQETDSGYYVCSAENIFGVNSTAGRLLIGDPLPPLVIIIEPSENDPLSVREGDSVTLRCTAVMHTSLSSVLWSRDTAEVPITGVTQIPNGALLSITPARKDDSGQYTCTVTDSMGTSSSQSIELLITTPPTFTTEPSSVTGTVGMPLTQTLSCVAEGDPFPVISWLRPDLTPLSVDPLTNAPQFDVLSREDAGTYTCLAANSAGEVRTEFTITIEGPPIFTTILSNISTHAGQDVIFRCIAEGPPNSSYTWTRMDGSPLPSSSTTITTTLHLFSVSSSDSGAYRCTATNRFGTITTQGFLNVLANPVITSATTTPITTLAGTSFSLNCIATGPAETVLKWYLNDTLLDPDSDPAVMIDNDGTLTVISPGISYTGAYTCNVSTSFTFVLSRVNVIVGSTPTIVTLPRDVDLVPGMTTLLDCTVSGFPHPHVNWFKTGFISGQMEELGIVGPSHIQLSVGLQLQDVGRNDSGIYECVAENAVGRTTSQATVRIESSPIIGSIQPTTITVNTTTSLTCSTLLNFPLGVTSWTKQNGASLSPDRYSVDESGTLTISPVLREDEGEIVCTIRNRYGESSFIAIIIVLFPPVINVTTPVEVILESTAVVSCSAQGQPRPVISWTIPDGRDADSGDNTIVDALTGELTIENPEGHNTGTYTCHAVNRLGTATDTVEIIIQGPPVSRLIISLLDTTVIRVQWNQPINVNANGYRVLFRRVGRQDVLDDRMINSVSFSMVSTFSDLLPGVEYEVTVSGIYTDGVVGLNTTIQATTHESVPSGQPQNFKTMGIGAGIYMEWSIPAEDERNGVIIGYEIEYRLASNDAIAPFTSFIVNFTSTIGTFTYRLRGLAEQQSYDVQIRALTAVGSGPPTSSQTVVTLTAFAPVNAELGINVAVSVGAALGGVALIAIIIMGVALLCRLVHRKRTKVGKHKPLVNIERGHQDGRNVKRKKVVSGPIPGITPHVDSSVQGKFTVQGENGNFISLKPKVITDADVAPPPPKGENVQKVKRQDTVLDSSNDETENGRIDAYSTPADALKSSQVLRQKKTAPVEVHDRGTSGVYSEVWTPPQENHDRVTSGIYSEVSHVQRMPPKEEKEEIEDKPYEEVNYEGSSDIWRREALEESESGSKDSFDRENSRRPPGDISPSLQQHPEAPDLGTEDSRLIYATVPKEHIDKKRENRLKKEQKLEEVESKQQEKMREKLERENWKKEEKKKKQKVKEEERERKRLEAERKKRVKDAKLRDSMGLSNIVSYQDIDFKSTGARAQADFIDAATAAMF